MQYFTTYNSPLGEIYLCGTQDALTGLWFAQQKYAPDPRSGGYCEASLPVFEQTRQWLDIYFSGRKPDLLPPIALSGSVFRMAVWEKLLQIPYGKTTTYGAIAKEIAADSETETLSAQAVGGAVGHNPISIIVPCHRVLGSDASLTGYAGGLERKLALLRLEGVNIPRK